MRPYGMEYLVTQNDADCRVDRVVKNLFPNAGYAFLQKLFRQGKIKINGKKAKACQRLEENDVIRVFSNQLDQNFSSKSPRSTASSSDSAIEKAPKLRKLYEEMLIFENEDFLALNKKSGLAVQLGSKLNFCVETILKNVMDEYFLVHRLDKDTSGVLLIAKNRNWARKLTQLFRDGKIQKTYWAVVDGKIRKSGVIQNFIGKSFVSGEERMTVVREDLGKSAVTDYRPINEIGCFTLLELRPKTGRKHQLRVHCSETLKAPILGDKKYNKRTKHKNLFLHAKRLEIAELGIQIEAPLPQYFREISCQRFD
ncbi:MAG: RluA family pseudouridine synthase [Alphaproteobacteria bacterium]|nr:RluA family pseudouridine synthase [Alphaproteobacteria bacterium]